MKNVLFILIFSTLIFSQDYPEILDSIANYYEKNLLVHSRDFLKQNAIKLMKELNGKDLKIFLNEHYNIRELSEKEIKKIDFAWEFSDLPFNQKSRAYTFPEKMLSKDDIPIETNEYLLREEVKFDVENIERVYHIKDERQYVPNQYKRPFIFEYFIIVNRDFKGLKEIENNLINLKIISIKDSRRTSPMYYKKSVIQVYALLKEV